MNGLINKLIAVALAIAMQLPTVNLVMAQSSPDIRSPVIELEVIVESSADNVQLFTARVLEDILLKDVLLYHRRAGQQPFTPVAMVQTGNSDNYSISLETDPTDLRAIEYYIQARDEGGNRTVEGFAFDPYTRALTVKEPIKETVIETPVPVTPAVTSAPAVTNTNVEPAPSQASTGTGKVRWWHIVAGVLVVGAVASLASGGSDGGESNTTGEGTVPLTINITGPSEQ